MTYNMNSHLKILEKEKALYMKKRQPKDNVGSVKSKQVLMSHVVKLTLSAVLFCLMSFSQTASSPKKLTEVINQGLQFEFPFAPVYQWYNQRFGQVIDVFVPLPDEAKPLALSVSEKQQLTEGLTVSVSDESIYAVESGVVIYVGKGDSDTEEVTVQHTSGKHMTYQGLNKTSVLPYQFIRANEKIGEVQLIDNKGEVGLRLEKNR